MKNAGAGLRVAAVILTKNEERDLPGCLQSLQGFASDVYVVDSGSTDRTVQLAEQSGAQVLVHKFESHSQQFNWALDNISTDAEWIFKIDADERMEANLVNYLLSAMPNVSDEVKGFLIPRRICFLGRKMRFGDTYPVWLLRLWRKGFGRSEDRLMDEQIVLSTGQTARARGDLIHVIPKDLTEWTAKHNWYATRECTDILSLNGDIQVGGPAGERRRMKQSVFLRLPPFFRSFAYWIYRYFVKLGFLDGKAGLIYHFLQGFWYRFLVDAKLHEHAVHQQYLREQDTPGELTHAGGRLDEN